MINSLNVLPKKKKKTSTAHLQAEARRRSRINERLDALRTIVPHTERANTAVFLEDVVRYVQRVQHRVLELELKLGLPPTVSPPTVPITFGDSSTPEGTLATNNSQQGIDRLALQAVLQQAAATVAAMPPSGPVGAAPPRTVAAPTLNSPLLPSVSEEMAMAAQLAPENEVAAERATMDESQLPAAVTAAADDDRGKRHQSPEENEEDAPGIQIKRRRGAEKT